MTNNIIAGYDFNAAVENRSYNYRWIPTVTEETMSGTHEINLQAKHFTDRTVFITGEINDATANDFVSQMLYLASTNEPIKIIINSPGGSVNAGLVIYDLIQELSPRLPIDLYCTGEAASMGAIIFAGGQKGHRHIMPHSRCMIHEPLISGGLGGSASSIKKTSESILEVKDLINGILSKHTGKSKKEIDRATAFDNYLNATESIKFGLCDDIAYPF